MYLDNPKSKLLEWIKVKRDEIIDFVKDFIAYDSVTGSEKRVQEEFVAPFLSNQMEWDEIDIFAVDPEQDRPNVNAFKEGKGGGRHLLFNGHVDVVPVSEDARKLWTRDPWKATVEDGKLYGRGSNDMKGGMASMLWATKAVSELGIDLKGDLAMEFVVGEELMQHQLGTTAATKRLLEKGRSFDLCIDPEPTYNEIHHISAGTFTFEVSVTGKAVHTSMRNLVLYPQRNGVPHGSEVGVDAVSKLNAILALYERLEREWVHRWRHESLGSGGYPMHEDYQG